MLSEVYRVVNKAVIIGQKYMLKLFLDIDG